jgi:hypothetical protein
MRARSVAHRHNGGEDAPGAEGEATSKVKIKVGRQQPNEVISRMGGAFPGRHFRISGDLQQLQED